MKEYTIFIENEDFIIANGTRIDILQNLESDFKGMNCAFIEQDNPPEGFSFDEIDEWIIEGGALQRAPEELIQKRRILRDLERTEEIRLKKQQRYTEDTDSLFFECMEEMVKSSPDLKGYFESWINAKEEIREEIR